MSNEPDVVWVTRSAQLSQVCVLVLSPTISDQTLTEALAEAVAGWSSVIVLDCLRLDVIYHELADQLIATARILRAQARRLIVVNAPEHAVPVMRAAGVDIATTTDRVFVVDPRDHPDRDFVSPPPPGEIEIYLPLDWQ